MSLQNDNHKNSTRQDIEVANRTTINQLELEASAGKHSQGKLTGWE